MHLNSFSCLDFSIPFNMEDLLFSNPQNDNQLIIPDNYLKSVENNNMDIILNLPNNTCNNNWNNNIYSESNNIHNENINSPQELLYSSKGIISPPTNILSNNTINNKALQIPKISRVVIVSGSNLDSIAQILQSNFNPMDLIFEKIMLKNSVEIMAIGWYDLRHIPIQLEYLNKIIMSMNLYGISFSYIADDNLLHQVTNNNKLNFFVDTFDIVYLYVHCQLYHFNLVEFQKDMLFQLSKFGAVYNTELINSNFICFKCRFYNIRTSFVMRKSHKIKIFNYKVNVFQTISEVEEYNSQYGINKDLSSALTISSSEWKKHQVLKHRRLGSIPFSTHSIKNENKIDLSKILVGEDNRVTLMIKNIPNKVQHESLKRCINQISFGDFDFLCMSQTFITLVKVKKFKILTFFQKI